LPVGVIKDLRPRGLDLGFREVWLDSHMREFDVKFLICEGGKRHVLLGVIVVDDLLDLCCYHFHVW